MNILLQLVKKICANLKRTTEQGFKKFLGEQPMSSIVLRPTDEHEVIKILARVSNNKYHQFTLTFQRH